MPCWWNIVVPMPDVSLQQDLGGCRRWFVEVVYNLYTASAFLASGLPLYLHRIYMYLTQPRLRSVVISFHYVPFFPPLLLCICWAAPENLLEPRGTAPRPVNEVPQMCFCKINLFAHEQLFWQWRWGMRLIWNNYSAGWVKISSFISLGRRLIENKAILKNDLWVIGF